MDSDKEFDYSWDDQDPDQMTDLVSGEYAPSPDIEDYPSWDEEPECSCERKPTDVCDDCGHSFSCCQDSNCSLGKKVQDDDLVCTCEDSITDECDNCGHVQECKASDCDYHSDLTTDEGSLIPPTTGQPPRLTPSKSLVDSLVQLRQLKSKIREMEEEEQALRDMIVEATGDRESLLIDPKDPNNVLAAILKKPFTWMRAGGQASLKKNHPELFQDLYATKIVTRLVLKSESHKDA
jgi:hypothetical protein